MELQNTIKTKSIITFYNTYDDEFINNKNDNFALCTHCNVSCGYVFTYYINKKPHSTIRNFDKLFISDDDCCKSDHCTCGHITDYYGVNTKKQEEIKNKLLKLQEINDCSLIIKYYDVFYNDTTKSIMIEYELFFSYLQNVIHYYESLPNKVKLDSLLKFEIIRDISNAVNYLHNKNIIHKNISSDNIFICQDNNGKIIAKLGGFDIENTLIQLSCNSKTKHNVEYLSCEILTDIINESEIIFTKASDIFALGILYNEIII